MGFKIPKVDGYYQPVTERDQYFKMSPFCCSEDCMESNNVGTVCLSLPASQIQTCCKCHTLLIFLTPAVEVFKARARYICWRQQEGDNDMQEDLSKCLEGVFGHRKTYTHQHSIDCRHCSNHSHIITRPVLVFIAKFLGVINGSKTGTDVAQSSLCDFCMPTAYLGTQHKKYPPKEISIAAFSLKSNSHGDKASLTNRSTWSHLWEGRPEHGYSPKVK